MIYKHLLELAGQYGTFLFDAYGVFNFGEKISAPAAQVLKELKNMGKHVSIISNATAESASAEKKYAEKGIIKGEYYDELLTSGQFAYEDIQAGNLKVPGKKIYVAWTANFKKPEDKVPALFKNSEYEIVENIEDADFAYCGIPQITNGDNIEDSVNLEDFMPEIERILGAGLTLVCANPDYRALEDGRFVVRQGLVTETFEKMEGKAIYYGKPDPRIFDRALKTLGNPDRSKVLMIGDTLRTDIAGANRAEVDSCLVLERGVTANEMRENGVTLTEENIEKYAAEQEIEITHIVEKLPEGPLLVAERSNGFSR